MSSPSDALSDAPECHDRAELPVDISPSPQDAGAVVFWRGRLVALWRAVQPIQRQRQIAWALVWLLMFAFTLLVGQHVLTRYAIYHADAFDLGNMDQAVWNTLHGHLLRFTNRGLDTLGLPTRLSIHVEPILILLAPLYLIHSGPETLLTVQTLALALGGVPLFLLSLRRLPALPFVGVAFVAAYLLNPFVVSEALWDFHAVALATPLLLLALWALATRRYIWYAVAALLALFTKEDVGLTLGLLGLLVALQPGTDRRRRWIGAATIVISLIWVYICFKLILPHYNPQNTAGNNYWYRYSWLGATPTDAIRNILTNPLILFSIMTQGRWGYLSMVARTAGGFGLFAPLLLICALPELAVNILSVHTEQYSGFFQYNALIAAYATVAGVYGVAAWYDARRQAEMGGPADGRPAGRQRTGEPAPERRWWQSLPARSGDGISGGQALSAWGMTVARGGHRVYAWFVRLVESITQWRQRALRRIPLASRWIGPLVMVWLLAFAWWNLSAVGRIPPFWHAGDLPSEQQAQTVAQINTLLARIPADVPVAATDTLDPHLSDRYDLYLLPDPQAYTAQYVALDIPHAVGAEIQACDRQIYMTMLASGRYEVIGRAGSVVVLHRVGAPLTSPPPSACASHYSQPVK